MWMQKSVEGSSFSSSGNFHDRNRFGAPYASGGSYVIEYGGKLARGPTSDSIPDHYAPQMPRNDGRANWMADIRSSSTGGGVSGGYSGSGGGYQNDFARRDPRPIRTMATGPNPMSRRVHKKSKAKKHSGFYSESESEEESRKKPSADYAFSFDPAKLPPPPAEEEKVVKKSKAKKSKKDKSSKKSRARRQSVGVHGRVCVGEGEHEEGQETQQQEGSTAPTQQSIFDGSAPAMTSDDETQSQPQQADAFRTNLLPENNIVDLSSLASEKKKSLSANPAEKRTLNDLQKARGVDQSTPVMAMPMQGQPQMQNVSGGMMQLSMNMHQPQLTDGSAAMQQQMYPNMQMQMQGMSQPQMQQMMMMQPQMNMMAQPQMMNMQMMRSSSSSSSSHKAEQPRCPQARSRIRRAQIPTASSRNANMTWTLTPVGHKLF
ncbi:uncharacterized protein KRP23_15081 [Phytophthora ramorum]|uniref:uncharacterized protein n=1 Tax=Phytophthora ramorum TaxID=164328 RepID=UPI00309E3342|nr:hypothetical protein KRP23_15081 [Phytophthora ramorum]